MSKKKTKSWNNGIYQWTQNHEFLFIVVTWLLIFLLLYLFLTFYNIIPKAYRDFELVLPLLLNAFMLLMGVLGTLSTEGVKSAKEFVNTTADIMLWTNGILLPLHLLFGLYAKNGHQVSPALLTRSEKPIWLPIMIYVVCFIIAGAVYLLTKEKKSPSRLKKNKKSKH